MEKSLDILKEHNEEEEVLTVEKAEKLLFLSFRFSQGDPQLQMYFFSWLQRMHPDWKIDEPMQAAINKHAKPHFEKFLQSKEIKPNPLHKKITEVETPLELETNQMRVIFNQDINKLLSQEREMLEYVTSYNVLIKRIAQEIAARDKAYLLSQGGRERPLNVRPTVANDSWLSHLCYYALAGHSTGSEEYDQLFREIKNHVDGELTTERGEKFIEVIKAYNEKHPNAEIYADRITS